MGNLRSKLIRLAHTNPALRKSLLPLLKKGSVEDSWAEIVEFASSRHSLKDLLRPFLEALDIKDVFYTHNFWMFLLDQDFGEQDPPSTPEEFREFLDPIQKELKTLAASDSLTRDQKIIAQRVLNQIASQIKVADSFATKINVGLDTTIRRYLLSLIEAQKLVVASRRALLTELGKFPQEFIDSRTPLKKTLGVGMVDDAMAGLEKSINDTTALLKSTYR